MHVLFFALFTQVSGCGPRVRRAETTDLSVWPEGMAEIPPRGQKVSKHLPLNGILDSRGSNTAGPAAFNCQSALTQCAVTYGHHVNIRYYQSDPSLRKRAFRYVSIAGEGGSRSPHTVDVDCFPRLAYKPVKVSTADQR